MEAFIVVQPRKKKMVTVSDTTIVLNNENTFSRAFNGDDKAIKRTKTKTSKKKKKKLSEDKTKKRITPSWELLLECVN